jgi:signal transduction histidine kinase
MFFLKRIAYIGFSELNSHQVRRGVMLSNIISMLYCIAIVLIFAFRQFYADIPNGLTAPLVVLGLCAFLLPILLNRLDLIFLSRLFVCIVPIIYVWLVFLTIMSRSQFLEPSMYDSLRIFLIAFSFAPYLLFEQTEKRYMILAILPSLLSILLFEKIFSFVDLSYFQHSAASIDYELMQMRTIVAYLILNGACYTFQSIIYSSDKYSRNVLKQLKEKSDYIVAKNEELTINEDKLNQLNSSLGVLVRDKTTNLQQKNALLMKYAHSNAHLVRGPVARLLGLVQLSKLDNHISYPDLFNKIDFEVHDLDRVIKELSKEFNMMNDESTDD